MSLTVSSLPPQGNVMVVDDNPANLKLLEDMLRQSGYEVRSFPRGRLAVAAARQEPPDLILLDINMPEMNGYEVCEQCKHDARLRDIPVIFLSALNQVEDKVKGFRAGGVDYVSKPFQFEEVQSRVETHIKLRRAQLAERELLEGTLNGAVGTLLELVQLTSPLLAARSGAIRDIVQRIIERTEMANSWQYKIAAKLCLIGCIALPDEVFIKGYSGDELSPEESRMFQAHPSRGARLLSKIPRLQGVVEMVRRQLKPEGEPYASEEARQGARMLHLSMGLDRRVFRGATFASALTNLRRSDRLNGSMLDALEGYSPSPEQFDIQRKTIRDLRPGMVLEKDVISKEGSFLIFKAGTVLTETWIERLENFARSHGEMNELVLVRIPMLSEESAERNVS